MLEKVFREGGTPLLTRVAALEPVGVSTGKSLRLNRYSDFEVLPAWHGACSAESLDPVTTDSRGQRCAAGPAVKPVGGVARELLEPGLFRG